MATNKNITMKQFNGTDYDTLYPKTVASQVDGVYNKEETLTDGTKAIYGLDSKAVPDDVFAKIPTFFEPVGTIKTTVRTDLGDKWLLCNGAIVDPATYPELCALLPSSDPRENWVVAENFPTDTNTNNIKAVYDNGYYVAWISSDNTNGQYMYATSLNGPWTTAYVLTSGSTFSIANIKYLNGYWIICGRITNATGRDTIYYATSLNGTWTLKRLGTDTNTYINDIMYRNGSYIACGATMNSSSYASLIYYSSSLDGTWTKKSVSGNRYLDKIKYENGYYIAIGSQMYDSYDGGYFVYAADFAGTWSLSKQFKSGDYITVREVSYINGKWVACGYQSQTSSGRIYTSTSISGSWTAIYSPSNSNCPIYDVLYENGLYLFRGSSEILITSDLPAISTDNTVVQFDNQVNSINYNDGTYFCGSKSNIGIYLCSKNILPNISANRAYVYIKAKE